MPAIRSAFPGDLRIHQSPGRDQTPGNRQSRKPNTPEPMRTLRCRDSFLENIRNKDKTGDKQFVYHRPLYSVPLPVLRFSRESVRFSPICRNAVSQETKLRRAHFHHLPGEARVNGHRPRIRNAAWSFSCRLCMAALRCSFFLVSFQVPPGAPPRAPYDNTKSLLFPGKNCEHGSTAYFSNRLIVLAVHCFVQSRMNSARFVFVLYVSYNKHFIICPRKQERNTVRRRRA